MHLKCEKTVYLHAHSYFRKRIKLTTWLKRIEQDSRKANDAAPRATKPVNRAQIFFLVWFSVWVESNTVGITSLSLQHLKTWCWCWDTDLFLCCGRARIPEYVPLHRFARKFRPWWATDLNERNEFYGGKLLHVPTLLCYKSSKWGTRYLLLLELLVRRLALEPVPTLKVETMPDAQDEDEKNWKD